MIANVETEKEQEKQESSILAHDDALEIDNLPNRITIFRVALVPVVIACLYLNKLEILKQYHLILGWVAAITFGIASITDFFDGYIARKRNIITVFGSFLDPIADKFLVISSLIMLESLGRIHSLVVVILVLREVYMTSLRLLATSEGISVPVNQYGKWKTAIQMTSIPFLMVYHPFYGLPVGLIGTVLIYIASILSLFSAAIYSVSMIKKLKQERLRKKQLKKQKKQIQ